MCGLTPHDIPSYAAGALCFYFFVWPFLWSALRAFWAQNVLAPYRERQVGACS
jgi:hypothetical protein